MGRGEDNISHLQSCRTGQEYVIGSKHFRLEEEWNYNHDALEWEHSPVRKHVEESDEGTRSFSKWAYVFYSHRSRARLLAEVCCDEKAGFYFWDCQSGPELDPDAMLVFLSEVRLREARIRFYEDSPASLKERAGARGSIPRERIYDSSFSLILQNHLRQARTLCGQIRAIHERRQEEIFDEDRLTRIQLATFSQQVAYSEHGDRDWFQRDLDRYLLDCITEDVDRDTLATLRMIQRTVLLTPAFGQVVGDYLSEGEEKQVVQTGFCDACQAVIEAHPDRTESREEDYRRALSELQPLFSDPDSWFNELLWPVLGRGLEAKDRETLIYTHDAEGLLKVVRKLLSNSEKVLKWFTSVYAIKLAHDAKFSGSNIDAIRELLKEPCRFFNQLGLRTLRDLRIVKGKDGLPALEWKEWSTSAVQHSALKGYYRVFKGFVEIANFVVRVSDYNEAHRRKDYRAVAEATVRLSSSVTALGGVGLTALVPKGSTLLKALPAARLVFDIVADSVAIYRTEDDMEVYGYVSRIGGSVFLLAAWAGTTTTGATAVTTATGATAATVATIASTITVVGALLVIGGTVYLFAIHKTPLEKWARSSSWGEPGDDSPPRRDGPTLPAAEARKQIRGLLNIVMNFKLDVKCITRLEGDILDVSIKSRFHTSRTLAKVEVMFESRPNKLSTLCRNDISLTRHPSEWTITHEEDGVELSRRWTASELRKRISPGKTLAGGRSRNGIRKIKVLAYLDLFGDGLYKLPLETGIQSEDTKVNLDDRRFSTPPPQALNWDISYSSGQTHIRIIANGSGEADHHGRLA
ncbi:hypothetical protein ACFL6M_04110 [Candidatus Eisenbacteria bacterium]|uniref:Uncharacterized protein n=1 Tax=Eiseniibacteriota bacterium TaxID=2212470 RepID=A0ABV6YKR9_UNCEI